MDLQMPSNHRGGGWAMEPLGLKCPPPQCLSQVPPDPNITGHSAASTGTCRQLPPEGFIGPQAPDSVSLWGNSLRSQRRLFLQNIKKSWGQAGSTNSSQPQSVLLSSRSLEGGSQGPFRELWPSPLELQVCLLSGCGARCCVSVAAASTPGSPGQVLSFLGGPRSSGTA